jgi:hypothetical protein
MGILGMPFRRILLVLFAISLFSIFQKDLLQAGDQYGWVHGHFRGPVPYYVGNPKPVDPHQKTSAALPVEASPRAYPYGYFGAQYRPYTVSHQNYYNDFSQWSFRRGY